jgi:putative membrane protein
MRTITILSLICGLLLGTGLVGYFGFGEVLRALFSVRWTGFLAIIAYQLGVIALLGLCWYVLTPHSASLLAFIWGRLIRDSGSEVLPLSQLGGFVMGARAAMLLGVPGSIAVASTIVDVTMELFGQLGYTALGLGILAWQKPNHPLIGWTALGLVVALLAGIGFVAVQRRGLGIAEHAISRITKQWVKGTAALPRSVRDEIRDIYLRPRALWLGGGLHLAAWIASSVQAWIALRFMGIDLGFGSVLAIESLLYAIRSVAFAVPNAVGIQEGAYVMLGAAFGLMPETALALSLLKRARDLAIGVPALLFWQMLESGRLLGRRLCVNSRSSERPAAPIVASDVGGPGRQG